MVSTYYRFPLGDFPDVVIHADELSVRTHAAYTAAKQGDSEAAYELVHAYLDLTAIERIRSFFASGPVIVGMGSTLANLRGWIMRTGAHVSGAAVLTGKGHSAKLTLNRETIYELRKKHGTELEAWWNARFGFGYDCLTNAEAGYLLRTPTADRIRNRITEKIQEGDQ